MVFGKAVRTAFTRAVAAACVLYLVADFLDFERLQQPDQTRVAGTKTAVVLGGGEARISAGLKLIDSGAIARLFVSGENLDDYKTFVSFYSWRNPDLKGVDRMLECCIEWSGRARSTIENAAETKCWLRQSGVDGPIALLTGPEHLPRATLIFSRVLGAPNVIPYAAPDPWHPMSGEERMRASLVEYMKFIGTRAYLLLVPAGTIGASFC
jgi:DUF218 domain